MTYDAIQVFLQAAPFRQFTVTTAAGKTYRVMHPDFVTFTPSRRTMLVYTNSDFFDLVDVEMATEINHTGPRPVPKSRRKRSA